MGAGAVDHDAQGPPSVGQVARCQARQDAGKFAKHLGQHTSTYDLSNLGLTRCVDQYLVDIRAVDCEEGGTDALAGQFGHLFAEGGNPFFGTWS